MDFERVLSKAVQHTHIHPSWRNFDRIDVGIGGTDLWRISFADAPVNARLSIRIPDGNACVENPADV